MKQAKRLDLVPPYLFGEIARLKQQALDEGRSLIDLGIGDPDQPTPEPIIDSLCEAARKPENHRYDETAYGSPAFLSAARDWFARKYGVDLDTKGEMLLLIGSKEGLTHLPRAITEPGDVVLIPDPAYSAYAANALMADNRVAKFRLKPENGWLPDFSEIATDDARQASLMYINYPNNPTGAIGTLEFMEEAVRFSREYDIALCSDAAYCDVTYDGYQAPSVLQVEGAKDVAIEFYSLSKSFNMTGWRIGFAAGNRQAIAALNKLKGNVDSKQFPAISEAGAYALANCDNRRTLEIYKRRRDVLVDGLNSIGWNLPKPQATFYVWARCPSGYTSIDFCKELLEKAGVLAIPGIGYGDAGEGWFRMSLTVSGDSSGELMSEAVERIRDNFTVKF